MEGTRSTGARGIISAISKHSRRSWPWTSKTKAGRAIRAFSLPDVREIPVPRPPAIGVASSSFENDNEANLEPAATVLRFRFSGPLQPECIYDFDVTTGALSLRKQDPGKQLVRSRSAMRSIASTRSRPTASVFR